MIVLQLLLYCLLFTAMVKIAVLGGAVNGLYFYPKSAKHFITSGEPSSSNAMPIVALMPHVRASAPWPRMPP